MRPLNVKLVQISPRTPTAASTPARAIIPAGQALEFVGHLARKHSITGDLLSSFASAGRPGKEKRLRDLWELTDLSADEFADEVAHFYKLPRLDLPQLLAASSLAGAFSHRFLREMAVFPCRVDESSGCTLVVADPTDAATIRAAELTLGEPVALAVGSFEDIATALSERLGEDELDRVRTRRYRSRAAQ